jgi:uroporphyrinogen-III synthase/uroporphyrinogen III methyltransferase/synthase
VLVTRALQQAGKLSDGLRALGAEPVEVPVLEIRPPESFAALDAALNQLHRYDWLILTSANTVNALAERAAALGLSLAQMSWLQVAAVGEGTAAAARLVGLQVIFVPESNVAESLVEGLLARTVGQRIPLTRTGQRILLARAAAAREIIPDTLRKAGADVDVVEAYRNMMPETAPEQLRQGVADGLDAATFTSSSSVTHLAEAARMAGIPWPLAGIPAVSIGPITSQTLRELDWPPAAEADPSDIPGLIAAVVQILHC